MTVTKTPLLRIIVLIVGFGAGVGCETNEIYEDREDIGLATIDGFEPEDMAPQDMAPQDMDFLRDVFTVPDAQLLDATPLDFSADSGIDTGGVIDGNINDANPGNTDLPEAGVMDAGLLRDVGEPLDQTLLNECITGTHTCDANADCEDEVVGYRCVCRTGFEGDGVDCSNIDDCIENPCLNQGICIDGIDEYHCDCPMENMGTHCEYPTYSQAELDYFLEVVMNIEFGGTGMQRIHKWTGDLTIEVHGDPTPIDLAELDLIVAELNELQSEVTLSVVPEDGNVQLYFSGVAAFRAVEPNYRNGNNGFFWTYWRGGAIVRANIFVLKTQAEVYRRHLLREELTQSMGLMNDSNLYDDSIFYARWTDVTAFSDIDRTIIGMLYREDIEVNMGAEEVLEILDPE